MAYDASKDTRLKNTKTLLSNGSKGTLVSPSNSVDLTAYAKAIVLLTAGNVAYIPVLNADDAPMSFVDLPAGWVSPHQVRRVNLTGTTATVATVED
jgi:hypothetical protein